MHGRTDGQAEIEYGNGDLAFLMEPQAATHKHNQALSPNHIFSYFGEKRYPLLYVITFYTHSHFFISLPVCFGVDESKGAQGSGYASLAIASQVQELSLRR